MKPECTREIMEDFWNQVEEFRIYNLSYDKVIGDFKEQLFMTKSVAVDETKSKISRTPCHGP